MIDWKQVRPEVKAEHDRLYRICMEADREVAALRAKDAPLEEIIPVRKRYREAEIKLAMIRVRVREQRNRAWN